jgi:acetyltransferase
MNAVLGFENRRCAGGWRERPYREMLVLREGRVVTLRPAHHSDKNALQSFFATLSPRSRLLRFHGGVNELPDAVLRAFTTQVPCQHVALVAMAAAHDGQQCLVAEARYVADVAAPGRAEFALTVADGWQGLGLGGALLRRLATHAASEGLEVLDGRVIAGNVWMLGLLRGLGASLRSEGAEVHAALPL